MCLNLICVLAACSILPWHVPLVSIVLVADEVKWKIPVIFQLFYLNYIKNGHPTIGSPKCFLWKYFSFHLICSSHKF